MYQERKKFVLEKNKETKEYDSRTKEAERLAKDMSDKAEKERAELALKLDAEMKHRVALEQHFREQEELSKALAAKQDEENRHLNEQLRALEKEKSAQADAQRAKEVERRIKEEHDRLIKKQAQDHADLSRSVMDIKLRRQAQDGAIEGQLIQELARSRNGLPRSNPGLAVPSPLHRSLDEEEPIVMPGSSSGASSANAIANPASPAPGSPLGSLRDGGPMPDAPKSPLLQYSTAALRSISTAASSWSSQAWGIFGKLAQPLFSPSLDQKIRLGRNKKSSVCGSSFVDVSAPNTVRRTTLLPRYHPIGQNTTKITPDELNLNAEYFFRFREAMILSLVNHPNILRFHSPLITADHSITLEAPLLQHDVEFLASEMLDGSPSEVMETIRSIMTQLLLAVHYLHSLSVLHLNIKPSSLLIHRNHPTDPAQAYLTAFSKARAKGSHDSFVATLDLSDYPYSLAYMSPQFAEVAEAARSGRPSPKIDFNAVDMWSIGCVLACLLGRGCDLFRGATNAHSLDELARQVNVDFINRFVTNSMRRRRRRGLPDLAQAPQYKAAVKLAAELLQYNPANRPSALQALQSQFINLNQDIVPPTVQEPFDDEALPRFALLHRGVPNRFEIVHPDD